MANGTSEERTALTGDRAMFFFVAGTGFPAVIKNAVATTLFQLGDGSRPDDDGPSAEFLFNGSDWVLLSQNAGSRETSVSFTSSGSWVCPRGVSVIAIEGYGGGGGGGGGASQTSNLSGLAYGFVSGGSPNRNNPQPPLGLGIFNIGGLLQIPYVTPPSGTGGIGPIGGVISNANVAFMVAGTPGNINGTGSLGGLGGAVGTTATTLKGGDGGGGGGGGPLLGATASRAGDGGAGGNSSASGGASTVGSNGGSAPSVSGGGGGGGTDLTNGRNGGSGGNGGSGLLIIKYIK